MADNLWSLREQKRLSVATLASRAGLPIGLIMEYESGQRSIDPRHLSRIARALYVEESEIKLHSDPRPGIGPLERQQRRDEGRPPAPTGSFSGGGSFTPAPPPPPRMRERQGRAQRLAAELRPPAPARQSQIAHLQDLLIRLGRSQSGLEAELGKPLTEMDRVAASRLLGELQAQLRLGTAERHRAYLPEAVDQYELRYLSSARDTNATLRFKLFDNSTVTGQLTGFSPYTITVQDPSGNETTLNKLAIVSYTKVAAVQPLTNGREPQA